MNFYQNPPNLEAEIDSFERALVQFQQGNLHPTRFRALRVPFGVYEQRKAGTFMLRIRATAGGITPRQLETVARFAERYGSPEIHVTTRQELQIHDLRLENTPEILRGLLQADLSSRGGGGNTVRNIMASCDAGLTDADIFDVTPHAAALTSRLIGETDSWNFPRKFKISFSSKTEDNALAAFNDLGFIAARQEGRRGFKVFVAGGMGCRPRLSRVLHDFIEEDRVYHVCAAVKQVYLKSGNRRTKNSGRLRFLWEELGEKKFLELYHSELDRIRTVPCLQLDRLGFANSAAAPAAPTGLQPGTEKSREFAAWERRYVEKQHQDGLFAVRVPLALGNIRAQDAVKLSRFLSHFGENTLRLTMSQNLHLRNIPRPWLGSLFALVSELDTLSTLPRYCGEIIGCTGADTCTTGVCLPQGVIPVIQDRLLKSGLDQEKLEKLKIHISGCPNSCGQHHVADLGFYGRIARKNGKTLPGYWVGGGASVRPETRSFTEKCGWVAARDLPDLVVDILSHYQETAENIPFYDYFHDHGKEYITSLCEHSNSSIPACEDDPGYYYDWGADTLFTTAHMGHGECSAGIYDMIEVSMNMIKEYQQTLATGIASSDRGQTVARLVCHAAGMLLVTRGLDPSTEKEIYACFTEHFLDRRLVKERFRPLIAAALAEDTSCLAANSALAIELGEAIIQLYHSMDNSLTFKCEMPVGPEEGELPPPPGGTGETFKDLRGVSCPMNFVRTKVELAKIQGGGRLRILLDDGEPIDNVPRSVITEGHRVISQERSGDAWSVLIEKKCEV